MNRSNNNNEINKIKLRKSEIKEIELYKNDDEYNECDEGINIAHYIFYLN